MTTPGTPDANQPPPPGGYPPPAPGAGGYTAAPQTGGYPAAPQTGGYPPAPGYGAPDPAAGGYPPPPVYGAPDPAAGGYAPPAGTPYGAVDPNAFGAAGYPPPGSVPPPPARPGAKRNRLIIIAVALVVIAGIVVFAVVKNQKTSTTAANVGACIKVDSVSLSDAKTEQAPCSDLAAAYVVTETGGSDVSCDDNEAQYTESKDNDSDPTSTVCLRPNLQVGDCWKPALTSFDSSSKVACTDPSSSVGSVEKLVKLITGSTDDSGCPDTTTKTLTIDKRQIVYCFADVS